MDKDTKIELLNQQIQEAGDGDPADFNLWREKTSVVLRNVIGDSNPLYISFNKISYTPRTFTGSNDFAPYRIRGVQKAVSILEAAKLEVQLSGGIPDSPKDSPAVGTDIFIVHGHDNAVKHEVARFLAALTKREPVILHEQANNGLTLLEKFEQYAASTAYAVVLATPDDVGRAVDSNDLLPRARQNVVFELGFFFGALGRSRVALLYKSGVETPSDVNGLAYIHFDDAGAWKMQLAREIEQAGVGVQWDALRS